MMKHIDTNKVLVDVTAKVGVLNPESSACLEPHYWPTLQRKWCDEVCKTILNSTSTSPSSSVIVNPSTLATMYHEYELKAMLCERIKLNIGRIMTFGAHSIIQQHADRVTAMIMEETSSCGSSSNGFYPTSKQGDDETDFGRVKESQHGTVTVHNIGQVDEEEDHRQKTEKDQSRRRQKTEVESEMTRSLRAYCKRDGGSTTTTTAVSSTRSTHGKKRARKKLDVADNDDDNEAEVESDEEDVVVAVDSCGKSQ